MKLGHALAGCFWIGAAASVAACSDPPAEPAQGALEIAVSPAAGGGCVPTHGQLLLPSDTRVSDRLSCDLTQDCKPGEYVAVDGDTNTSVSCSVSKNGDNFNVTGQLRLNNDSFGVSGLITSAGGKLTITHYSAATQTNLRGQCDITIPTNKGVVASGRIWVNFNCPAFTDPSAPGGSNCAAAGKFLFEKCGG